MYNPQLETFLKVAALGSFSAAAQSMYISPSAVIQQINSLERELNVSLFERSRHGVALTEAGRYLQSEAADYILRGNEMRQRLNILSNGERPLRIGTSENYKVRLLFDLWTEYARINPSAEAELFVLQGNGENAEEVDLIEGLQTHASWQKNFMFYPLRRVPIGICVGRHHPLAGQKLLTPDMLADYELLIASDVLSPHADDLMELLVSHQIYHEIVHNYGPNIIWNSTRNGQLLLAPLCWKDSVHDVEIIPVDWDINFDYGIFYHRLFNGPERGFVEYIRQLSLKERSMTSQNAPHFSF